MGKTHATGNFVHLFEIMRSTTKHLWLLILGPGNKNRSGYPVRDLIFVDAIGVLLLLSEDIYAVMSRISLETC